jgi:hypothetical protein
MLGAAALAVLSAGGALVITRGVRASRPRADHGIQKSRGYSRNNFVSAPSALRR